ncbi:MAG TPA: hypothetical protein VGJ88_02695 [Thermoanaerobaculia bacterium]|jgi:hypothetical protein
MQQRSGAEAAIEVLEWVDTRPLSSLVASFARVHILLSVFDGNADAWLAMIASSGTDEEVANDAPFLTALKRRLVAEPHLIDDLRTAVQQFADLMT